MGGYLRALTRQRLSRGSIALELALTLVVTALGVVFIAAALFDLAANPQQAAFFLFVGLFSFGISTVPFVCDRWRAGVDAQLRRTGVPTDGTVIGIFPSRLARGIAIARYAYQGPDGVPRQAEAYDWADRIDLKEGDKGRVLVDPDRPGRSMWVLMHA
jgi:hypothetical protein